MEPIDTSKQLATAGEKPARHKLDALGDKLRGRFEKYEKDRRSAELRWMQNLRQFLGQYDPEIEAKLTKDQSRAYPRLTRVKCVSMVSRLMNLLFPSSEKNWQLAPSPVPNLPQEALQEILERVQMEAQGARQQGESVDLEGLIDRYVRQVAKERAKTLEGVIDDQLAEIGGNKHSDYVAMCRKVLMSGVLYSTGVLGGPYVQTQTQQRWRIEGGQLTAYTEEVMRPRFEFVPIWDYYPDMSAKTWDQMDGQFQRYVMSRKQVSDLTKRPDFLADEIRSYLKDTPDGNYKRRTHETELKAMGVQNNVNESQSNKYELFKWEGYLYKKDLDGIIEVPEDAPDEILATVWIADNRVLKADLNPWYRMAKTTDVKMYHHFVFEEDDTNIFGNGLPNIMRDSQMSVSLAARMALDNASVVCGPQAEVDLRRLRPDQDLSSIHAFKIWYRDEDIPESQYPAVKEIKFDSHLNELTSLMQTFMGFADMETFISPATGGDMSQGPSEPFRTATGASMLKSDAALPFKDVVRNFDNFTESVISSLVTFNHQLNDDPDIKGDYQTIAKGAMSLVAKEIRGYQLDSHVQTMQAEERQFVDWYKLARERAAVRDLPIDSILVDEDEARQIQQQSSQSAQEDRETQRDLIEASVRQVMAETLESLSKADQADAQAANQQLQTLIGALNGSDTASPSDGAQAASGGQPGRAGDGGTARAS